MSATRAAPERQRDAVRTRTEILDVATREFADRGFASARVDEIAAQTRTTKRMIYYYFGGKEQLYIAVLERAYATAREAEAKVDVDHLDPLAAIRLLAELTFDHHESHPEFIRLVSIENIHHAEHMAKSEGLRNLNSRAIERIERILDRGRADGVIRRDVDPVDLHAMISAFCVFRVARAPARDARRHGRRVPARAGGTGTATPALDFPPGDRSWGRAPAFRCDRHDSP